MKICDRFSVGVESKMKCLVLFILLCSEVAWPEVQSGTVIFLDFQKDSITLSADSKSRAVQSGKVVNDCKIVAFGNQFVVETAGLLKDDVPGGWDIRTIARRIWRLESQHETDASGLVRKVSEKWIERMRVIYNDADYIRHKRKTHPEGNVIANVAFIATDNNGHMAARGVNATFDVRVFDSTGKVKLDFPFIDLTPPYWISAGSNEIIMEYQFKTSSRAVQFSEDWALKNAKLTTDERNAAWAKEMIALSLKLHPHPEEIGPPVEVLQIKPRTGIRWVADENKCANKQK